MQMGGFRWKWAGIVAAATLFGALAGCKSNAGSAINDEGVPTADTGYISAATTGGDAAGTANMKVEEEGSHEGAGSGAEHMQGGRASTTPQQQGGGTGG